MTTTEMVEDRSMRSVVFSSCWLSLVRQTKERVNNTRTLLLETASIRTSANSSNEATIRVPSIYIEIRGCFCFLLRCLMDRHTHARTFTEKIEGNKRSISASIFFWYHTFLLLLLLLFFFLCYTSIHRDTISHTQRTETRSETND